MPASNPADTTATTRSIVSGLITILSCAHAIGGGGAVSAQRFAAEPPRFSAVGSSGGLCRRFLAVDQPRNPESINDLAEPQRPEGFLKGYLHGAPFRQSIEDTLCLRGNLGPEHHAKALRLLVFARHGITALQYAVA